MATAAFFWVIFDLLMPIVWAVAITLTCYPMYQFLLKKMKGRKNWAAITSTAIVLLCILLPLVLLGIAVTHQAFDLYDDLGKGAFGIKDKVTKLQSTIPMIDRMLYRLEVDAEKFHTTLQSGFGEFAKNLAQRGILVGRGLIEFSIQFSLMIYLIFFLFADGSYLVKKIIKGLPLGDDREQYILNEIAKVSVSTLKGNFLVASVQGAIGGILFLIVGIKASLLWAVVMAIFSLLPAIGAAIIWLPAAVFCLIDDDLSGALVLFLGGTLIIGLVDNFLRPILVGRETRMPDYLVLFSTVGGINAFGLSGFIVGPIIAALFLVVWDELSLEQAGLRSTGKKRKS